MRPNPLTALLAAAAPPRCAACGEDCDAAAPLCAACDAEIGRARPMVGPGPPGVDLAVGAAPYEGAARLVAHGLKYGRRISLATLAAERIAAACPEEGLAGALVPVPPAPWRGRWRGFDPAEEIALALARISGTPYVHTCLRRGPGPRQVGRPRRERLADPPRIAFRGDLAPRRALLVDDVHTTGATLSACARALRTAGAEEVWALVFARSRPGRPNAARRL